MCVHSCAHVCAWVSKEARGDRQPLGAGVTSGCEPPGVGAENQISILYKNSKRS